MKRRGLKQKVGRARKLKTVSFFIRKFKAHRKLNAVFNSSGRFKTNETCLIIDFLS
jgi:hypothetical protein